MIDDPVDQASSSLAQANSRDDHKHISSPRRDKCTPIKATTNKNSATKSRSLTPSIEFSTTPSKPSSAATATGSSLIEEPAKAPLPIGDFAARLSQSCSRSRSRAKAWMCLANSWPNETGCACCKWVKPGAGLSTCLIA